MIVITGARGFIGSNLVEKLNQEGYTDLVLVDELERSDKDRNIAQATYRQLVHRDAFLSWLDEQKKKPEVIFHLGARTDTAEFNTDVFDRLNLSYSKSLWSYCTNHDVPFIYASSAATYGDGALGYDDEKTIEDLQPLNPYGWSKQHFDVWVLQQQAAPPFWAGLKFFNVFGPNEYHKGRMASVVFHAYHQIQEKGTIRLFESHKSAYNHGEQQRDFIYVKDVVAICFDFFVRQKKQGIYNVGTGTARSFNDLAKAVFSALNTTADIEYFPIPEDIRDTYQYYTEATTRKLREQGCQIPFTSLEGGVKDYVQNYLMYIR